MIALNRHLADLWSREKLEYIRFFYPLNGESLVIDIGAAVGNFTRQIWNRFRCNIHAFEPNEENFNILKSRFGDNPKIVLFQLPVTGRGNVVSPITDVENGFFLNEEMESADINYTLEGIEKVDLLKINIEGGEYELLENIKKETLEKIDYLQVQFHILDSLSWERRNIIQDKLSETHRLLWCYEFVWECWQKK